MKDSHSAILRRLGAILTILSLIAFVLLLIFAGNSGNVNPTQVYIDKKLSREAETYKQLQFNLVDPNDAPAEIKKLAVLGFNAMIETKKYAADYVGNRLTCTNCHFAGGNTTGGPQGGISLAGVATKYPAFDARLNKVIDLEDRINSCFMKSMNGKPLPLDGDLMLAFLTYFQWISKNLPIYSDIPWLGMKSIKTDYVGDAERGEVIYDLYCGVCHNEDSKGKPFAPPLWGNGAANDAAGMTYPHKLATFIYWNMPYNDSTPVLSEEEALDVAAYIISKPRPHFVPSTK
jgi:thiosulfate dehydrogenase